MLKLLGFGGVAKETFLCDLGRRSVPQIQKIIHLDLTWGLSEYFGGSIALVKSWCKLYAAKIPRTTVKMNSFVIPVPVWQPGFLPRQN